MCDQQPDSSDNVRAEYEALIAYHNSIITHRFTLIGFFIAALGFIIKDGLSIDKAWLILVVTISLYMVERRNRVLFTKMSKRAMEIEKNHWKFNRSGVKDKTVSLFWRFRLDELSKEEKQELPAELKEDLKRNHGKYSIRRLISSHTNGMNILYAGVAIYAIVYIVTHYWK